MALTAVCIGAVASRQMHQRIWRPHSFTTEPFRRKGWKPFSFSNDTLECTHREEPTSVYREDLVWHVFYFPVG